MPLNSFQTLVVKLLAANRSESAYLAGGAAINLLPESHRYSSDLDYFHDSEKHVQEAFQDDLKILNSEGFDVEIVLQVPSMIRAVVSRGSDAVKIEWVHDTAWRFLPLVADELTGFRMHPVDLAINKVLALAGRNEARDYLDVIVLDQELLPLGALCWAACGKDPGYSPQSLLEMLKRKGPFRKEDFLNLQTKEKLDLVSLKVKWIVALEKSEEFIKNRPASEAGCLYWHIIQKVFVAPESSLPVDQLQDIVQHFGRPAGVLPLVK
ncbi:MAG TPA: nucleotidyl transferase AbiEii/AbiGii toxin family protein [Oligoflexia bacterium]|nr:nucleotidyl transferase AbiEii/AbiGii toxin family protein [Oligoflexia bacterium]HMP49488.1 nucleotidyl transferase AbiEii/AbiGii toxin family protein [Oligoflexia bacterium]